MVPISPKLKIPPNRSDAVKRTSARILCYNLNTNMRTILVTGGPMRDIFEASALGDKAQVAHLLTQDKELAKSRNAEGKTPLHLASWGGYAHIITLLLEAGADINSRDNAGSTALGHMTGWCTRADIVDLLIARGADIDLCDNDGASPLALAASYIHKDGHCWGDHKKLTQHLIDKGAKIDVFTAAILNRTE